MLALFPGEYWGTSLMLSLLAPFRPLGKVIVHIFRKQRNHGEFSGLFFGQNVSDSASLDRVVANLALYNSTEQAKFQIKKILDSAAQDCFFLQDWLSVFLGKRCFHMQIKAVATSQWSSGNYLRISQNPFLGFQSDVSLSGLATRPCPVLGVWNSSPLGDNLAY